MISKNRDVCIVNGDLTLIDSGLLNVELISKDSTVVDGDEVVTSYISDKYLPGILIGYISEVTMDESELTYNAKLTPAVDFEHLSSVLVIKQLKSEITSTETKSETEVETEVETDYGGEQEES
jgi:rod shape-determining protein MreC